MLKGEVVGSDEEVDGVEVVSGRLGSGKSALAEQVAVTLNWPTVSFGRYVRSVAEAQGIEATRENLQELGAALIEREGMRKFAASVLHHAGWSPKHPAIVEGIRHAELPPILRSLVAPVPFNHVHLLIADDVRRSRLEKRGTGEVARLASIESHSTEVDVAEKLEQMADLVLNAGQPPEILIATVLSVIRED